MKYKVGDKVKIKTWEKLEKEFGLRGDGETMRIHCKCNFISDMENDLPKNRIVTIKTIEKFKFPPCYKVEEISWNWSDDMIECKIIEPIYSRFELLDI